MNLFSKVAEWVEHIIERDHTYEVTVKKGDSLWRLAEELTGDGANWQKIAAANPEKNFTEAYTLHPGDVLHIPKNCLGQAE